MKELAPRYGCALFATQGKTYAIATDKPPAELAGFWSDVNFACIAGGSTHDRITDTDAQRHLGIMPEGAFTYIKWQNRRIK